MGHLQEGASVWIAVPAGSLEWPDSSAAVVLGPPSHHMPYRADTCRCLPEAFSPWPEDSGAGPASLLVLLTALKDPLMLASSILFEEGLDLLLRLVLGGD